MGCDRFSLFEQCFHRFAGGDADQPHGPSGMRPTADRNAVGIVDDEANFLEGNLQPFAQQLRKARLVALPAAHRSDDQIDITIVGDGNLGTLARNAARHFDVVGDTAPAAKTARSQFRFTGFKAVPITFVQRRIHRRCVVAAVIGDTDTVGKWHVVALNKIAAAEVDFIEAMLFCSKIDQTFDHIDRFRPTGASVNGGRGRVCEDRVPFVVNGRDIVSPLHHRQAFSQRPEVHRVSAEVERVLAPQCQEFSVRVERQFRVRVQVPRLIIAEETFRPIGRPFHGPVDFASRPGHEREFGREGIARPEIAAHIAEDGTALLFLDTKGDGKAFAGLYRTPAGGGAQCIEILVFVVFPDDGPWFHRTSRYPVDTAVESHDVGRTFEGSRCRIRVADLTSEGNVRRATSPNLRCADFH